MSEETKLPTTRIIADRAEWEPEDNSDSDKHVLAVGPFDAIAFGHCRCGCNAGPGWSIEFDENVEGDFAARSLEDAQQRAESELRKAYEALAAHYAPVLRWRKNAGGSVASLGPYELCATPRYWSLRYCERDDWCRVIRESPRGYAGKTAGDEAKSRRDAEEALRGMLVVFRVEEGE